MPLFDLVAIVAAEEPKTRLSSLQLAVTHTHTDVFPLTAERGPVLCSCGPCDGVKQRSQSQLFTFSCSKLIFQLLTGAEEMDGIQEAQQ